MKDPIGQAIYDYHKNGKADDILIHTNYTTDEHIPPSYFFRTVKEMPSIEQTALKLCHGRILDVGAAAGCHSIHLQNLGMDVTAMDESVLSAMVMKERGIRNAVCKNIMEYGEREFDTILVLMNGTGIGRTLSGLKKLLLHLKLMLSVDGVILTDSSDIRYLFEEEDGSLWIDIANDRYYGEMDYYLSYKNLETTFKWLFVDFETLREVAESAGLKCRLVKKGENNDYLACLTL